ncbi:MAG: PDZ domain-containing protein [Gemmataceae bacterium]|nr:PDZ domain-containing protein [Gemmataceae bacterium]
MLNTTRIRGLSANWGTDGLEIRKVSPGSAGEAAGIEAGDCIVDLFGMPFNTALRDELIDRLEGRVRVGIRDGRTRCVTHRWIDLGTAGDELLAEPIVDTCPVDVPRVRSESAIEPGYAWC